MNLYCRLLLSVMIALVAVTSSYAAQYGTGPAVLALPSAPFASGDEERAFFEMGLHAPFPVHHGAGRVVEDQRPAAFSEPDKDSVHHFAQELTLIYRQKLGLASLDVSELYGPHAVPLRFDIRKVDELLAIVQAMILSCNELTTQATATEDALNAAVARSLDLAKLPLELLYFILRFAQLSNVGTDEVVRTCTEVSLNGWTTYCSLLKKLYALYKVTRDATGTINRHRIREMLNKDATLMDLFRTLEFPCVKRALPQDSYGLIVSDTTLRTHDKFVQLISARRNVVRRVVLSDLLKQRLRAMAVFLLFMKMIMLQMSKEYWRNPYLQCQSLQRQQLSQQDGAGRYDVCSRFLAVNYQN